MFLIEKQKNNIDTSTLPHAPATSKVKVAEEGKEDREAFSLFQSELRRLKQDCLNKEQELQAVLVVKKTLASKLEALHQRNQCAEQRNQSLLSELRREKGELQTIKARSNRLAEEYAVICKDMEEAFVGHIFKSWVL